MKKVICLEGGGESKQVDISCREGFRKLFEKCGFVKRMPRLFACGGRSSTFENFKTALANAYPGDYVAMLIDSEDPITAPSAWGHLKQRDAWDKPANASDEQVLFMATCMETWIVADRQALTSHYKNLKESALPPLIDLENRKRHDVQENLILATRNCANAYAKGKRSFKILGELTPETLTQHLPNFKRAVDILNRIL